MKTVIVLLVAVPLLGFAQNALAELPDDAALVLLEKKLHGDWKGGPCMGDWTFGADNTFALKNFSPGGNTFTGAWKVRWDSLPATLVLSLKTSDDPHYFRVGQAWEVKLVQLDDETLAYQRPQDAEKPVRCTRAKK